MLVSWGHPAGFSGTFSYTGFGHPAMSTPDPITQFILDTLGPTGIVTLFLSPDESLTEKQATARQEILALTADFTAPMMPPNADEESSTVMTTALAGVLTAMSIGLNENGVQTTAEAMFSGAFAQTGRDLPGDAARQMAATCFIDLLKLTLTDPEGQAKTAHGIYGAWVKITK